MKNFIFFGLLQLLLLLPFCSKGQSNNCKSIYDSLTNLTVYINVDELPVFPGGTKEMMKFFSANFVSPENDVFHGSFQLEFIIDGEGNLIGPRIMNKTMEALTEADKEAIRVFSIMPQWRPGKCNGEIVPTRTYIPMYF